MTTTLGWSSGRDATSWRNAVDQFPGVSSSKISRWGSVENSTASLNDSSSCSVGAPAAV